MAQDDRRPAPDDGRDTLDVAVGLYGRLDRLVGGRAHVVRGLAPGATVSDLLERLSADLPELAPRLVTVACAVGDEIVPFDRVLQTGDEVAVLPPVSGG